MFQRHLMNKKTTNIINGLTGSIVSAIFLLTVSACSSPHRTAPLSGGNLALLETAIPQTSFFIAAHPDDWQLFMNPAAFRSMDQANERAVFVHLTAGDAGAGLGIGGGTNGPTPYYASREEGAMRAIRFMANAVSNGSGGMEMQREIVIRGDIRVQRITYANTVSYFLRLPDGNMQGEGYSTTSNQSLYGLFSGRNASIRSVDGNKVFEGWASLVGLLDDIFRSETTVGSIPIVHVTESDSSSNPGDHSDHYHASIAGQAAADRSCMTVYRHDTYATNKRPMNVNGDDLAVDIGTWAATTSGLSDKGALSNWEPSHNSWLGRSYARKSKLSFKCDQKSD
jgi:hypothetical protein